MVGRSWFNWISGHVANHGAGVNALAIKDEVFGIDKPSSSALNLEGVAKLAHGALSGVVIVDRLALGTA